MFNSEFFQYLGLLTLTYAIVRTLYSVFMNVGVFWFEWFGQLNFREYGSWAVITGGTDGMGKCYVTELAKRGLNVVVISNEKHKFDSQKKYIEEKYAPVKAKFIYADFTGINF